MVHWRLFPVKEIRRPGLSVVASYGGDLFDRARHNGRERLCRDLEPLDRRMEATGLTAPFMGASSLPTRASWTIG